MPARTRSRKQAPLSKGENTYAREIDKIKPTTVSKNVSNISEMDYNSSMTAACSFDAARPTDVKTLMAKLTGVGHMIMPKDIKRQKWLISCFFTILFSVATIGNGIIIYGIETVIHDTCYSPFKKIIRAPDGSGGYICPSFSDAFVRKKNAYWIRLFEIGSTVHTIAIGIAMSGVYYLNFTLIVIYVILFIIGLTLMLASTILEIIFVKIGLFTYFNLPDYVVLSFLAFFILDVIHLFASINLQVRWINYLTS